MDKNQFSVQLLQAFNQNAFKNQFLRAMGQPKIIQVLDQHQPKEIDLSFNPFALYPFVGLSTIASSENTEDLEFLLLSFLSGVVIQISKAQNTKAKEWNEIRRILSDSCIIKFGHNVEEHTKRIKKKYPSIILHSYMELSSIFNNECKESVVVFGPQTYDIYQDIHFSSTQKIDSTFIVKAAQSVQTVIDFAAFTLMKQTQTRDPVEWASLIPLDTYNLQLFRKVCRQAKEEIWKHSLFTSADKVRTLYSSLKSGLRTGEQLDVKRFQELTTDFLPVEPVVSFTHWMSKGKRYCDCTLSFDAILFNGSTKTTETGALIVPIKEMYARTAVKAVQEWTTAFLKRVENFVIDIRKTSLPSVQDLSTLELEPPPSYVLENFKPRNEVNTISAEEMETILRRCACFYSWRDDETLEFDEELAEKGAKTFQSGTEVVDIRSSNHFRILEQSWNFALITGTDEARWTHTSFMLLKADYEDKNRREVLLKENQENWKELQEQLDKSDEDRMKRKTEKEEHRKREADEKELLEDVNHVILELLLAVDILDKLISEKEASNTKPQSSLDNLQKSRETVKNFSITDMNRKPACDTREKRPSPPPADPETISSDDEDEIVIPISLDPLPDIVRKKEDSPPDIIKRAESPQPGIYNFGKFIVYDPEEEKLFGKPVPCGGSVVYDPIQASRDMWTNSKPAWQSKKRNLPTTTLSVPTKFLKGSNLETTVNPIQNSDLEPGEVPMFPDSTLSEDKGKKEYKFGDWMKSFIGSNKVKSSKSIPQGGAVKKPIAKADPQIPLPYPSSSVISSILAKQTSQNFEHSEQNLPKALSVKPNKKIQQMPLPYPSSSLIASIFANQAKSGANNSVFKTNRPAAGTSSAAFVRDQLSQHKTPKTSSFVSSLGFVPKKEKKKMPFKSGGFNPNRPSNTISIVQNTSKFDLDDIPLPQEKPTQGFFFGGKSSTEQMQANEKRKS